MVLLAVELLWYCYGTAMVWLCCCNVVVLYRYNIAMILLWDTYSIAILLPWYCYGTAVVLPCYFHGLAVVLL